MTSQSQTTFDRIYDKYATHKTFYSTQINTQYDLFTECQYPQLINSTQHPTALRQYPISSYLSSYLCSTICSIPAYQQHPASQQPNSLAQYPITQQLYAVT